MYEVGTMSIYFHAAFFVLPTSKKPLHYLRMLLYGTYKPSSVSSMLYCVSPKLKVSLLRSYYSSNVIFICKAKIDKNDMVKHFIGLW